MNQISLEIMKRFQKYSNSQTKIGKQIVEIGKNGVKYFKICQNWTKLTHMSLFGKMWTN